MFHKMGRVLPSVTWIVVGLTLQSSYLDSHSNCSFSIAFALLGLCDCTAFLGLNWHHTHIAQVMCTSDIPKLSKRKIGSKPIKWKTCKEISLQKFYEVCHSETHG
jgi:hypothetical protein